MCKCTPAVRTPFCGKLNCEWPKPEGTREPEETDPRVGWPTDRQAYDTAARLLHKMVPDSSTYKAQVQVLDENLKLRELLAKVLDEWNGDYVGVREEFGHNHDFDAEPLVKESRATLLMQLAEVSSKAAHQACDCKEPWRAAKPIEGPYCRKCLGDLPEEAT